MILEEVFAAHGIQLRNSDGSLRNLIDVLEDMYLKLGPRDFNKLTFELSEEEKYSNIFDQARNRYYRGAE
jgi:hypothetical protein